MISSSQPEFREPLGVLPFPSWIRSTDWWLAALLVSILFTPTFRLPCAIPIRLDDLLVFGTGAVVAALAALNLRTAKLDSLALYLLLLITTILLSTLLAPPQIVTITAKDYLDVLRPAKFLLVYWILSRHDPKRARDTFLGVFCISVVLLLGIACLQMLAIRVSTEGPIVAFFSAFTEREAEDVQLMMTTRPFATFDTPVHLGYVAILGMFLAAQIRSRVPRVLVISASFLTLLLSVTRTLLFALPVVLLMRAVLSSGSFRDKLKRLTIATALTLVAACSVIVLLPAISPPAAEFTGQMIAAVASGDVQQDFSITTRLENLGLVAYTWQNTPILGVGGRSLLPPFVDSEIILTFHRYGLLGLLTFLSFYPVAYALAQETRSQDLSFANFVVITLVLTFLMGVTQAVLINSRMGVLPFAILGIGAGWRRYGFRGKLIALATA